jgi:nicotinamide riboside transporter PnuC
MKDSIRRWVPRGIHFVLSIPIIGYIYAPVAQAQLYAPRVRFIFLPLMVLSGLWMWKGHSLRRFISKRTVWQQHTANATNGEMP